MAATLEATLLHPDQSAPGLPRRRRRDQQASYAAYRKLVYETRAFTDYFFSATPIREIAELNIGSRPASRKATRAIEDLRAIPGASAGASAAWRCPAGAASARPSKPGSARTPRRARTTRAAAEDAQAVAVLPHAAVESRHGAGQERPRHRGALRRAGGRQASGQAHLRPHPGRWQRTGTTRWR